MRLHRQVSVVLVLAGSLHTLGCGDSEGPVPVPDSVTILPDSTDLMVGEHQQFIATVLDDAGAQLTGQAVNFTSSDSAVATVTTGGLATAVGGGDATITATAGEASGTAHLHVLQAGVPDSLVVTPASLSMTVCIPQQLLVSVYDELGDPLDSSVTFTSSDPSVAEVSSDGVVVGKTSGSTDIVVDVPPIADTVTAEVVGVAGVERVCIPQGAFGVAISQQNVMYVSAVREDRLVRFDLPSLSPVASVTVGSTPGEVVFSPDGHTVYTPEIQGTAAGVVDVATNQRTTGYDIGESPFRVRPSADGASLYVASHTGHVYVFDTSTGGLVTSFAATSDAANGIALSPDGGSVYVSSIGGEIAEISTASNTVLRTLSVPGYLQGIALSPDGSVMYVADENGPLKVVDVASGTVTGTISGADGGFGLRISPDGTVMVVTLARVGTFYTIDRATEQITDTYVVGGTTRRIAFDPAGAFFVVANEGGWIDIVR